jgi:hypothetical protein
MGRSKHIQFQLQSSPSIVYLPFLSSSPHKKLNGTIGRELKRRRTGTWREGGQWGWERRRWGGRRGRTGRIGRRRAGAPERRKNEGIFFLRIISFFYSPCFLFFVVVLPVWFYLMKLNKIKKKKRKRGKNWKLWGEDREVNWSDVGNFCPPHFLASVDRREIDTSEYSY